MGRPAMSVMLGMSIRQHILEEHDMEDFLAELLGDFRTPFPFKRCQMDPHPRLLLSRHADLRDVDRGAGEVRRTGEARIGPSGVRIGLPELRLIFRRAHRGIDVQRPMPGRIVQAGKIRKSQARSRKDVGILPRKPRTGLQRLVERQPDQGPVLLGFGEPFLVETNEVLAVCVLVLVHHSLVRALEQAQEPKKLVVLARSVVMRLLRVVRFRCGRSRDQARQDKYQDELHCASPLCAVHRMRTGVSR